eukprot:3164112-Pyramimonas_sp.AAC.1
MCDLLTIGPGVDLLQKGGVHHFCRDCGFCAAPAVEGGHEVGVEQRDQKPSCLLAHPFAHGVLGALRRDDRRVDRGRDGAWDPRHRL